MDAETFHGVFVVSRDASVVDVDQLPYEVRSRLSAHSVDRIMVFKRKRTRARLLSPDAARLLDRFDGATPVSAILRDEMALCGHDADAFLPLIVPLIDSLVGDEVLVPVNRAQAPSLPGLMGTRIAGFEVVRALEAFDVSAIYELRSPQGVPAILKIGDPTLLRKLNNEYDILKHLEGLNVPGVLQRGKHLGLDYIVLDKLEGASLALYTDLDAAERLTVVSRADIGQRLLDAYAALHGRGVVHGDVHPGNVLVSEALEIHLLDFGDSGMMIAPPERQGGVERYLDPEYYRAIQDDVPCFATDATDQYAVSVMLFELLTGSSYLDLSFRTDTVACQIINDAPRSFAQCGVYGLDEIEKLVSRGLSKVPADRHESMAVFSLRFREARRRRFADTATAGRSSHATAARRFGPLTDELLRELRPGAHFEKRLRSMPLCSAHYGAAGIAAVLARASEVRPSADILLDARTWLHRAAEWSARPDAFWTEWNGGVDEPEHARSLHFGRLGIVYARARFLGAAKAFQAQSLSDVVSSTPPFSSAELSGGLGGHILTLAIIERGQRAAGERTDVALFDAAQTAVLECSERFAELRSRVEKGEAVFSGMAHGLAGILLCAAVGHVRILGRPLPGTWLDEAISWFREIVVVSARVPYARMTGGEERWAGWCNGLAGFMQFWTSLHALTGRSEFLDHGLDVESALRRADPNNATLCCGSLGIAQAYLGLYRATRHHFHVRLAEQWLERVQVLPLPGLYKGTVGRLSILLDLEDPDRSAMPFVEDCFAGVPHNRLHR